MQSKLLAASDDGVRRRYGTVFFVSRLSSYICMRRYASNDAAQPATLLADVTPERDERVASCLGSET
jgi:hypothetical protein